MFAVLIIVRVLDLREKRDVNKLIRNEGWAQELLLPSSEPLVIGCSDRMAEKKEVKNSQRRKGATGTDGLANEKAGAGTHLVKVIFV